jgi:hypothetical protein
MRLRALLNRHPALTSAAALVLAALAAALIAYQLRPDVEVATGPPKDFYTVDDGATWFVGEFNKVTPFDHDGRPAVLARVFTCDGGKTRFVGYLEKLPEGAAEKYRAAHGVPAVEDPEADDVEEMTGRLVKRKGETEWVSSRDRQRSEEIMQVRCPAGGGEPQRVLPE